MLTELLWVAFALLLAGKLGLASRLRGLGRKVERVVNAALVAIVLVYSAQILWWLLRGR